MAKNRLALTLFLLRFHTVHCIHHTMLNASPKQLLSSVIPEELADLLQEEIIYGRLPGSTRLTEETVAQRYGVSRSPVREALRLLERDGLVLRAARKGIWVTPMSVKDFDEVYSCRIALEGVAAEQAARSPDTIKKAALQGTLDKMRDAYRRGDVEEFFLQDVRGSDSIYELADNVTLNRLLVGLNKQALRYRFFAYARKTEVVALSIQGTGEIFDAIVARKAKRAKARTEVLISDIWQSMRSTIADAFGEG
jgi:DNA-binding GntR family transcriptional regulator